MPDTYCSELTITWGADEIVSADDELLSPFPDLEQVRPAEAVARFRADFADPLPGKNIAHRLAFAVRRPKATVGEGWLDAMREAESQQAAAGPATLTLEFDATAEGFTLANAVLTRFATAPDPSDGASAIYRYEFLGGELAEL